MLILYHFLSTLILIVFFPVFCLFKNKTRFRDRFGLDLPDLKQSGESRLWIHALSVGEVLSAIPLLEALRERYPSRNLFLSSKTATGLEIARKRLAYKVDGIFPMPLDFWWSNRRLVRKIQPSLFILVETDIWPGLIAYLKKSGIATILVNGRISPGTEKSYRRWRFLIKRVPGSLELLLMQSELDKYRIMRGGLPPGRVKVTGNIKFDRKWRPLNKGERIRWLELLNLKDELIWVAGSTHHPEEKIILAVFSKLVRSFPDLSLIIGPRDAYRFDEVYNYACSLGFNTVKKTELPVKNQKHSVFILNTLGELSQIYGLADITYVGGSLAPIGGHNLLEPASFGIPVLFGPHTFNFDTMSRSMIECGGGKMVSDESELLNSMLDLLANVSKREKMGQRAKEFVEQNQGALSKVMEILAPYVEGSYR